METDLIPYRAVTTVAAHRVLVLAPHPDDEVFGCGGAIASHVAQGVPVQVVVLTDGGLGGYAAEREAECKAAARCLGYAELTFWRLPDRDLLCTEALVKRVLALVQEGAVDMVYAPSPWEVHPDHRQTCTLATEVVKLQGLPVQLAFYEVGAPLRPNVLLDISPQWPAKRAAMACFASQQERQNYAKHIEALNVFRTYTLPANVQVAEAFRVMGATELARFDWATTGGWPEHLGRQLTSAQDEGYGRLPLVSVLVRSMNRKELARALDSVALQNHPRMEVIVVAATPEHDQLPACWGGVPLRLIKTDTPVPRSRAANLALQHARGDWLLLLDDDDWLLPDHVSRLAQVLFKLPEHGAAYTGVALVNAHGEPQGQVFDLPFDGVRLRAGNLMPIHSVMFRSTLLQQGLAFNESLDLYEDWDFWNQLARLTVMAHVPGVSAVYKVHDSSGVHDVTAEREQLANERVAEWLKIEDWTTTQVRERVWRFSELEDQLLQCMAQCGTQQDRAERAEAQATEATALLKQVTVSTSWKLTRPLREFRRLLGALQQERHQWPKLGQQAIQILHREGWNGLMYRLSGASKHWPWRNTDYESWRSAQNSLLPNKRPTEGWQPLFSVVMPVYSPPLGLLLEAVRSIQAQSYVNWELCMADDASPDAAIWDTLVRLAGEDPRIKVVRRAVNGHISRTSNDALVLASGDYVVLMDNDDLLPPDALKWVALALQNHPDAQILYSDEDKIDTHGRHFGPYLKPDWNRLLFMGHNLISHLGVFKTALVRAVGGFREGFEGSQDYDLALRCLEKIRDEQVIHIPRVLYHWRAIEGSTALASTEKPYAVLAAQRALQEHRLRLELSGQVTVGTDWNYRCHRTGLGPNQRLAVLVVGGDGTPPTWTRQRSYRVDEVRCCPPETAAIMSTVAELDTDVVLLTRHDLRPRDSNSLNDLVGLLMEPGVGAVAGTVCGPSGELLSGAWVLNTRYGATVLMHGLPSGNPGYMGRATLDQAVSAAHLDCMVVRPKELSGLISLAEWPWGWCAGLAWAQHLQQQKLTLAWCPRARWTTVQPEAYPRHPHETDIELLKEHWGPDWDNRLSHDPCYHPALDAGAGDFSFRWD